MGKLVRLIVGLWAIWLPIAGVMYVFSNGAVGEVEDATLEKLVHAHKRLDMLMDKETEAMWRAQVQKSVDALAAGGVDVRAPVHKLLKGNGSVSDLAVEKATLVKAKDGELQRVTMSFAHGGLKFAVSFLAKDKTFMAPWQAEVYGMEQVTVTDPASGRSGRYDEDVRMLLTLAALAPGSKFKLGEALPPDLIRHLAKAKEAPPPPEFKVTPEVAEMVEAMARNIGNPQVRRDAVTAFPLKFLDGDGIGAMFRTVKDQTWLVLNTVSGPNFHTCEIEGLAVPSSNLLTLQVDGCRLELSMKGDGVARVKTKSCSSMCGLNGTLDGVYAIGEKTVLMKR